MIVLAFPWLESYLDDDEEALYLASPTNLVEEVQIKLGKVFEAKLIDALLHDLVRKRIRDRGKWSLANRVNDLRERYGFDYTASRDDLDWISTIRNQISIPVAWVSILSTGQQ